MSKIYDENGWLNWDYLYPECRFIMAITGPRGTGKTYGLLKYVIENDIRFIYMRRLKAQLDNVSGGAENNPFKAYNTDAGRNIVPEKKSGACRFVEVLEDSDGNKFKNVFGYGVALSTVATIRGSDFSDIDCIVFDEYIAMTNEKPIKDEVQAFMNFLETVNRNRELTGKQPVKVFMLGNANRLMNPYFLEWHFMRTALKMIAGGQMMYRTPNNDRIMVLLLNSPISEKKKDTALYRIANDDFISMAIENAFKVDPTAVKQRKLTDCKHVVSFGSIGVYQLKSTGEHYISETINKTNYYEENEINLLFFRNRYALLKNIYLYDQMLFESYDVELLFREYIGIN